MSASLQLGRFAGIKVQIHWTFWLLFLFIGFMVLSNDGSYADLFWNFAFITALFICVVLHEFGHALAARRYGVGTRNITLFPIGGVANLKDMPENPKEEFIIAIAGPLVNVVIALLLWMVVPLDQFLVDDPEMLEEQLVSINAQNFLFYLFAINVALVAFNMIPAFPMDGGRVFRAILATRMSRVQATKAATALGKFLALLFFLFGLFSNIILAVIAVFIYFGAHSENIMIQQISLLEGNDIEDAMITDFTILKPDDTLQVAIDRILSSTEQDFIVQENDNVVGILFMSDLAQAVREKGKQTVVSEVMEQNIITLNAGDPLPSAYREFKRGNKNFFPVMDNGEIVGVLDMNNINEFLTFRAAHDY
ncbi:site-2 protease family protein [Rhodohalobacter barkolensis]|uniref:Zinc metalloprotease n=1 Tax=Rhodohalobacter barkolensis TaxID=2053187 RepID=A0A2N0VH86_9BACT|nr:site-2 protease family protein [Rhodohalobacter barkolensis]PKD43549.1 site-2 protease family protein [Rhodohalobacter barkolensis]